MLDEHDEPADATLPDEEAAPAEEREVRGLAWLLLPIPLGLAVGAALGHLRAMGQESGADLLTGGATGAAAGLVVGVVIWVFFPYKKRSSGRPFDAHAPQEPGSEGPLP